MPPKLREMNMNDPARNTDPQTPETETENTATEQPQAGAPQGQPASASAPLEARIAALEAELNDSKDRALRALAEAENTRKRFERMQGDTSKYAVSSFARDLLDVVDNLRRAIDAVPAEQASSHQLLKTLLDGIGATERVMLSMLEKHGVKKITPSSGPFDPNFHEVIFEAEAPGKNAGEIIQLIEPGYVIHDRLLRPARVGVAKGGANSGKAHNLDESV